MAKRKTTRQPRKASKRPWSGEFPKAWQHSRRAGFHYDRNGTTKLHIRLVGKPGEERFAASYATAEAAMAAVERLFFRMHRDIATYPHRPRNRTR
jgi:hypothetical protein